MGNTKKRKNSSRRNRAGSSVGGDTVTEAQIGRIREWLHRMEVHLCKAIALSDSLDEDNLSEEDNNFWALVKYAENVQECVVQLDNMKRSILEALGEVPLKSEQVTDLTWNGLKGMRSRLAHNFWTIDRDILWGTIRRDFPVLRILLSLVIVAEAGVDPNSPRFSLRARRVRLLPLSKPSDGFTLGNSLIMIFFDKSGRAQCLRIAKMDERTFVFNTSGDDDIRQLSGDLWDGEQQEHLGHWP